MPIMCFIAVWLIAGPFYTSFLGDMFTGRVSLWHACLENQGITLFGQPFQATSHIGPNDWLYYFATLDSAYADGLFVLGLFFCLFYCWAFWRCAKFSGIDSDRILPVLFAVSMLGVTEVHIFSVVVCFAPLLMGESLLKPKETSSREKPEGLVDASL